MHALSLLYSKARLLVDQREQKKIKKEKKTEYPNASMRLKTQGRDLNLHQSYDICDSSAAMIY